MLSPESVFPYQGNPGYGYDLVKLKAERQKAKRQLKKSKQPKKSFDKYTDTDYALLDKITTLRNQISTLNCHIRNLTAEAQWYEEQAKIPARAGDSESSDSIS